MLHTHYVNQNQKGHMIKTYANHWITGIVRKVQTSPDWESFEDKRPTHWLVAKVIPHLQHYAFWM